MINNKLKKTNTKFSNYLKKFKIHKNHFPRFNEECGVFGISGSEDAAALTALGLPDLYVAMHEDQELLMLQH